MRTPQTRLPGSSCPELPSPRAPPVGAVKAARNPCSRPKRLASCDHPSRRCLTATGRGRYPAWPLSPHPRKQQERRKNFRLDLEQTSPGSSRLAYGLI